MADTCNVEGCDNPIRYSLIKSHMPGGTPSRGVLRNSGRVVNLCKEHYRRKEDLAYMKNGRIIDMFLPRIIGWDNTWGSATG